MEAKNDLESGWLDGQRNARPTQSKWLHSTLSELDAYEKIMLDLIEAEGDTFAKRAETYYQNRPELIQMVQTLHKSYQALAYKYEHLSDKYEQLKSETSVKASNNDSLSNSSNSFEKQQPLLQDTGEQNAKLNPSLKAVHCDEKTIDYYLASGSESKCSSFEFHSPLNLLSTNSGIDESADEKDVREMNDLRAQELESKMRARENERRRFSKLLDENLSKQAELIRRNDEKREVIIGLKNENKLLKSYKSTGNVSRHEAKGSNSDSKRKFKRFFLLAKCEFGK